MQHVTDTSRAHLPPEGIDKWQALRALSTARRTYGLSDRDLSVLQALLSFHPETLLGPDSRNLVVHPSNRSICERLNGMACSTMRRHLARLVDTGVLTRRDSPNGKRYARRHAGEKVAYGFDLTPLLRRFSEFQAAAAQVQAAEDARKHLRETVSLMRRDLAGLIVYGAELYPNLPIWDRLSDLTALSARDLRRKLDLAALRALERELQVALDEVGQALDLSRDAEEMSTTGTRNEQHYQKSEKESFDRKDGPADKRLEPAETSEPSVRSRGMDEPGQPPSLGLPTVLQRCGDIQAYAQEPVRRWQDLVRVAQIVGPMMGISRSAWEAAVRVMGAERAAVTVAVMLERVGEIRSPGGYLRRLTEKASRGRFSCERMVAALSGRAGGLGSQL